MTHFWLEQQLAIDVIESARRHIVVLLLAHTLRNGVHAQLVLVVLDLSAVAHGHHEVDRRDQRILLLGLEILRIK